MCYVIIPHDRKYSCFNNIICIRTDVHFDSPTRTNNHFTITTSLCVFWMYCTYFVMFPQGFFWKMTQTFRTWNIRFISSASSNCYQNSCIKKSIAIVLKISYSPDFIQLWFSLQWIWKFTWSDQMWIAIRL